MREQRDVIGLDLHQLCEFHRIVLMMGRGMMRLGHAHLRVTALAEFPGEHEGEDPGLIRLICEGEEIEHEPGVLVVRVGHTDGSSGDRQRCRALLFGNLQAALDFADVIQIVAQTGAIARAEVVLETRDLARDLVENAAIFLERAPCACSGVPPSPKSRSKTTRGLISMGRGVVGVRQEIVFM